MGNFASIQLGPGGQEVYRELEEQRPKTLVSDRIRSDSGGSVTRLQVGADRSTVTNESVSRSSSMDRTNVRPDYSVVSTGRNRTSGRPMAAAELTPDSVVNVGGMETSVKVAVAMGLIRPAPGGGYEDVAQPPTQTPREAQQPSQAVPENVGAGIDQQKQASVDMSDSGAAESLGNEQAEAFLGQVANAVPPEQINAAMDEVLREGQLSEQSIGRLAAALGVSPEEAMAQAENLGQAYDGMIHRAVASVGIADEELQQDFMRWLAQTHPREADQALKALWRTNSTKAFRDLGKQFMRDLDVYDLDLVLEIARNSGIRAFEDHHGRVVLDVPGMGEVRWNVAMGQGLIPAPVAD